MELLNQNILSIQFQAASIAWFAIRIDVFGLFVIMFLIFYAVIRREEGNPVILALLCTQVLTLQDNLLYFLKAVMVLET